MSASYFLSVSRIIGEGVDDDIDTHTSGTVQ